MVFTRAYASANSEIFAVNDRGVVMGLTDENVKVGMKLHEIEAIDTGKALSDWIAPEVSSPSERRKYFLFMKGTKWCTVTFDGDDTVLSKATVCIR
jgi:hypothetical protein